MPGREACPRGVCEKVAEHAAATQSGSTLTKYLRRSRGKSVHESLPESSIKSGDRPDLYAGTPPPEALKAIIPITASHSPEFSLMHVDVSRAYFHAKAQRLVLVKLPAEDRSEKDKGEIGLLKRSMYGTRDAASNWERDWQGHLENWCY